MDAPAEIPKKSYPQQQDEPTSGPGPLPHSEPAMNNPPASQSLVSGKGVEDVRQYLPRPEDLARITAVLVQNAEQFHSQLTKFAEFVRIQNSSKSISGSPVTFVDKQYLDGSRYRGAIKDSLRDGFGRYNFPDGDSYEGMWKNNKQNVRSQAKEPRIGTGNVYGEQRRCVPRSLYRRET